MTSNPPDSEYISGIGWGETVANPEHLAKLREGWGSAEACDTLANGLMAYLPQLI